MKFFLLLKLKEKKKPTLWTIHLLFLIFVLNEKYMNL